MKKTRLSTGTVANVIKELKGRGFVEEVGLGRSVTGRRPMLLQFNPCARYVVGIEATAAQTRMALVDLAGRIVRKTAHTLATAPEPEAALRKACGEAMGMVEAMGVFSSGSDPFPADAGGHSDHLQGGPAGRSARPPRHSRGGALSGDCRRRVN